jgi:hypothetical protein
MFGIGFFVLGIVGLWILIDAFLIPSIVSSHNVSLAGRLS